MKVKSRTAYMYAIGKSDKLIGAKIRMNKGNQLSGDGQKPAEFVEQRGLAKGNTQWAATAETQGSGKVSRGLEGVREAAELLGMSPLEIDQLATFYTFIYREPVGKYVIHVCDSVVCWMNGYESVWKYLCRKLGIQAGKTTSDGLFTLLKVCCIGYCDRSPAMLINRKAYGNLTAEKIDEILEKLKAEALQNAEVGDQKSE